MKQFTGIKTAGLLIPLTVLIPALPDQDDIRTLWHWLAQDARSGYLAFVPDAFGSADWRKATRKEVRRDCIRRLNQGDLDLVLALGTWAGLDLVNDEHAVPALVMSTTDPVRSGIIQNPRDSGFDHVLVRCDPTRYLRQIRLFHDIFRFERLGVVYENNPDGKSYANLADLRKVARERDFKIVDGVAGDTDLTQDEAVEAYTSCCGRLAPRIDAFYFTDQRGAHAASLMRPLEPLLRGGVPTWASRGSVLVEQSALMSIARKDLDHLGAFYARTMAKILNGARPRALDPICTRNP